MDNSNYGMSAWLYQTVVGVMRTIAFISRNFSNVELSWSTPEKEVFVIISAPLTWDYLRGDKFIIRTDYDNLTFIRESKSGSAKLHRWFLEIQEYNFEIEHIKGSNNVVADSLSRFVSTPNTEIIQG